AFLGIEVSPAHGLDVAGTSADKQTELEKVLHVLGDGRARGEELWNLTLAESSLPRLLFRKLVHELERRRPRILDAFRPSREVIERAAEGDDLVRRRRRTLAADLVAQRLNHAVGDRR